MGQLRNPHRWLVDADIGGSVIKQRVARLAER